jgi:transcriptional regulator with XRE-family HTH domain
MQPGEDVWQGHLEALGAYIRTQRQLANLTLREMATLADVSNAYLSQVERGLHQPSIRILSSLAEALNLSAETLLAQAGLIDEDEAGQPAAAPEPGPAATVAAILADPTLTGQQKEAVLSVYKTFSTMAPDPDPPGNESE